MPRLLFFMALLAVFPSLKAEVTISPSEVYAQVLLIEKETELVSRHFSNVKPPVPVAVQAFDAQPRHVWQKGYMLQMKLIVFRRMHQLDGISPVINEPRENMELKNNWSQTQRILTEIRIVRKLLGVPGEVGAAPVVEDKKPIDVFNKLAGIEAQWDALTGADFDASHTFAQALRLNEDVDMVLSSVDVIDNVGPPTKTPSDTSNESLAETFLVLKQVQRLQKLAGLQTVDLTVFRKTEKATSADVFNMVCLVLAELQQIKARIGLTHAYTPAATFQEGKTPADSRQLLGYVANKLALIKHL